jgi:hypothetical protein
VGRTICASTTSASRCSRATWCGCGRLRRAAIAALPALGLAQRAQQALGDLLLQRLVGELPQRAQQQLVGFRLTLAVDLLLLGHLPASRCCSKVGTLYVLRRCSSIALAPGK